MFLTYVCSTLQTFQAKRLSRRRINDGSIFTSIVYTHFVYGVLFDSHSFCNNQSLGLRRRRICTTRLLSLAVSYPAPLSSNKRERDIESDIPFCRKSRRPPLCITIATIFASHTPRRVHHRWHDQRQPSLQSLQTGQTSSCMFCTREIRISFLPQIDPGIGSAHSPFFGICLYTCFIFLYIP